MDHERVGGIPMRCENFFLVRREFDRSDLRGRLDGVDACSSSDVPDM